MELNITHHFYLLHTQTDTLVEKLTWTQLNSLCRIIKKEDWDHFQIWVAEENFWVPLQKVVADILERKDGLFRAPPHPPERINGKLLNHQLVEAPANQREHVRFNIKIAVTLDIVGSLINAFTKDISLGGVRLENPVPTRKKITHCFLYYRLGDDLIEFKVTPFYDNPSELAFSRLQFVSCNDITQWKLLLKKAEKALQKKEA